jgi:hypothetical protein
LDKFRSSEARRRVVILGMKLFAFSLIALTAVVGAARRAQRRRSGEHGSLSFPELHVI